MEIWPNEVCDTSFGIRGLDDSFLFVFKVKEVVSFLLVNDICHLQRMSSHTFFLLNRCKFLLGNIRTHVFTLTWLSMSLCLDHSALLGQYQKWILFLPSLLRKDFFCCSNRVSDDSDVMDVIYFHGRDETSANSHKFGLEGCDVNRVDL